MPQKTRYLFGMMLAASCCSYGYAEESQRAWWPFGGGERVVQEPQQRPTTAQHPTAEPERPNSWRPSLPKFLWPNVSTRSGPHSEPRAGGATSSSRGRPADLRKRNAWANPKADRTRLPSASSPWQTVTNGAQRIGESTRTAWHKTVDSVMRVDRPGSRVARRAPRPSWWSRLWRAKERAPDGPRTIPEWMAQERLDP